MRISELEYALLSRAKARAEFIQAQQSLELPACFDSKTIHFSRRCYPRLNLRRHISKNPCLPLTQAPKFLPSPYDERMTIC